MPSRPPFHEELNHLIDASTSLSPPNARRRLRGRLRLGVERLARPAVLHQQNIDRAVMEVLAELGAGQARTDRELAAMRDELATARGWLAETSAQGDELRGRVGWLSGEIARIDRLVAADLPLGVLPLQTYVTAEGETVMGYRDVDDRRAGVYLGFEDVFRGSESDIAGRQRAYVPLLQKHAPVLDVGCGRGELLELLRADKISAGGVDLDDGMVELCRAKGLEVQRGDAVEALTGANSGSLGAIVAAQVIEHLPYSQLLGFLHAAHDALADDGIILLETVNPHAPQALKHFWIDPTHQHPLYPEVMLILLAMTGFTDGYIWFPLGTSDPRRDRAEQEDYVIVATASTLRDYEPIPDD